MRVVYMGTPDFAVPALEALAVAGYELVLVVAKADRPKDRGKKIQSCPVKLKALELGLDLASPEKLKGNDEFMEKLKVLRPDIIVVAAYGKILPPEILELPKYGCVNIHASLLPKYRGPAPIHRAVINGDKMTGVTLMRMAEGMDTGDMIAKAETPVGLKTTEDLHIELADMGAKLLIAQLPLIETGQAVYEKQDEAFASYAPMVFKQDGIIDFSKSAEEICCLVRGFYSWPTASTVLNGQVMKVHKAEVLHRESLSAPATVVEADSSGITVACGCGCVSLRNIQMPGKKAMDAGAFLLGNKIEIGTVLG